MRPSFTGLGHGLNKYMSTATHIGGSLFILSQGNSWKGSTQARISERDVEFYRRVVLEQLGSNRQTSLFFRAYEVYMPFMLKGVSAGQTGNSAACMLDQIIRK